MSRMSSVYLGAIEAGGTKFVCAVGTPQGELIRETRIPTSSPAETLEQVVAFFRSHGEALAAVGIASFGPVELNPSSPAYGFITSTPKVGWRNFDLRGAVRAALAVPAAFTTDVNAAALAESRWGAAQGLRTSMYVTVGTGIGGAAIIDGSILHGFSHPEMGHIRVPHDVIRDPFRGICPFHGDCLEGLASGPALEARWRASAPELAPDHPAWPLEAEYLALACVNWICTLSPGRIVLGGGLMRPHLFPLVREHVATLMNRYIDAPELANGIDQYVVPSALAGRAGVLGALLLASEQAGLPARQLHTSGPL
jgi:fructokinase